MLDFLLLIILLKVELLENLLLLGYLQMGIGSITTWLAVLFQMELNLVVLVHRGELLLLLLLALLSRLLGHTLRSHQEHLLRLALLSVVVRHRCHIIRSLVVLLLSLVAAWVASSPRGLLLLLLARLRQLLLVLFPLRSYGSSPR